jgi:hypothetical protein
MVFFHLQICREECLPNCGVRSLRSCKRQSLRSGQFNSIIGFWHFCFVTTNFFLKTLGFSLFLHFNLRLGQFHLKKEKSRLCHRCYISHPPSLKVLKYKFLMCLPAISQLLDWLFFSWKLPSQARAQTTWGSHSIFWNNFFRLSLLFAASKLLPLFEKLLWLCLSVSVFMSGVSL